MIKTITSRTNPIVAETAKLKERKYREEKRLFCFEGVKLFEEAVSAEIGIEYIMMTEKYIEKYSHLSDRYELIQVTDDIIKKISEEKAPQGIICTARYIDISSNILYNSILNGSSQKRIFMLSSVADPGNVGTVIRSAAAFGIDGLIVSSDCADLFSQKTVRASMGALFREKIARCDSTVEAIKELRSRGFKVCAATLAKDSIPLDKLVYSEKTAILLGNEGHGLSEDEIAECDCSVIIPITPDAESLNVSVAAGVLMYDSTNRK